MDINHCTIRIHAVHPDNPTQPNSILIISIMYIIIIQFIPSGPSNL